MEEKWLRLPNLLAISLGLTDSPTPEACAGAVPTISRFCFGSQLRTCTSLTWLAEVTEHRNRSRFSPRTSCSGLLDWRVPDDGAPEARSGFRKSSFPLAASTS